MSGCHTVVYRPTESEGGSTVYICHAFHSAAGWCVCQVMCHVMICFSSALQQGFILCSQACKVVWMVVMQSIVQVGSLCKLVMFTNCNLSACLYPFTPLLVNLSLKEAALLQLCLPVVQDPMTVRWSL